jgi:hypothetical protein
MSDTLTQVIDKVQDLLLDGAGTLFSTATCTAAVRQALHDLNLRAPIHAATLITAIADQKEYELTDEPDAYLALGMHGLYLQGVLEYDTVIPFDTYTEDERLWFRLRTAQPADDVMIAHFTIPHTVSGLDSELTSTLSAFNDQVLVNGSCYHACIVRAAGKIESNNLDRNTPDNYRELARHFNQLYQAGLSRMSARRTVKYEPDLRRWAA